MHCQWHVVSRSTCQMAHMYKKTWKAIPANIMANSERIMYMMVEMATSGEHRKAMLATATSNLSHKATVSSCCTGWTSM